MSTRDGDAPQSELIFYRGEDARTRIQVRLEGDSVWLSQSQLADLYQVSVKTVSEHLQNIFDEGEVEPERTIRKYRIVQFEGERQVTRLVDHYHLDAILAVGDKPSAGMTNWVGAKLRKSMTMVMSSNKPHDGQGAAAHDLREATKSSARPQGVGQGSFRLPVPHWERDTRDSGRR